MATAQAEQVVPHSRTRMPGPGPQVALITSYSGGNLGDAAIQDSMILNLRERLPNASFLGITLNGENFVKQHGASAFPMLASSTDPHQNWQQSTGPHRSGSTDSTLQGASHISGRIRGALRRVPGLRHSIGWLRSTFGVLRRERTHWVEGYRTLRSQDLLLISGGGQLDEEYGGPWRLPYTYFKWTLLARLARVPCALVSVGAGKIESIASRLFISAALRMCCYRSFRETRSKAAIVKLLRGAMKDSVIPDLAFSLPESQLPAPAEGIRAMARGRQVLALSPIAYRKPVHWPTADRELYQRYVRQMAHVLTDLAERGYFIVAVCSSLGDDESVIPDIVSELAPDIRSALEGRLHFPKVKTWRELVAVLRETDCLIASRLHGTILSFVSRTPVIAISFDPKVDWVMEDLGLTEYLLHIRDFTAADVLHALDRLESGVAAVVERIVTYRQAVLLTSGSARQYDLLASLSLKHHQDRI
jgi:polysaccharide pyruvyl transferase WcaK-like protein